jgi:hypothetical protein
MALSACGAGETTMTVTTNLKSGVKPPADGTTAVTISVVVKKDGELQNKGEIYFSTNLGTFDASSMEKPVRKTSIELDMGKAEASLYSVQEATATVRVEYVDPDTNTVAASKELVIDFVYALGSNHPAQISTIEFKSADPTTIKIFNTASEGQTSTKLTFQVLDQLNLPMANKMIYFDIPKPLGETLLVPTEAVSDSNGYVVTYLTSGRVAGVAEVIAGTARYEDRNRPEYIDNYVSGTAKIHVIAGSANYYNFSFLCERYSIGGFKWYGEQMECVAYVADRDTQEIPNQPVLFATEAGAVFPLIYTGSNGQAITTYTTQDPIPWPVQAGNIGGAFLPEQMVSVSTDSDRIISFLYGFSMPWDSPINIYPLSDNNFNLSTARGEIQYQTPPYYREVLNVDGWDNGTVDRNPRDGLVTVIAITGGEEPLLYDENQNGECDNGDVFLSLGEPFIDRDDNRKYDEGEYFLDIDGDAVWTKPAGATTGSKVAYSSSGDCSLWKKNTQIWKEFKFLWTGEGSFTGYMMISHNSSVEPTRSVNSGDKVTGVVLEMGQSADLDIYVLDKYMNPVASTSTDEISCSFDGEADISVSPETQRVNQLWGPAPSGSITVSASPSDPKEPKCGAGMVACTVNFSLGDKHTYSTTLLLKAEAVNCSAQ